MMQATRRPNRTVMSTAIALLLVSSSAAPVAAAEPEDEAGELAISAFADLQQPAAADGVTGGAFRVNQAEIDLEGCIRPQATAAMALAYDPESRGFTLAVLTATYDLTAPDADGLEAALTAGQFDVPFGLDWRVYASIDRRLVTPPLLIDGTHEGWNDQGANLHLAAGPGRADLFVVNGTSCGRGVQTCKVDRGEIRHAFGGRVGAVWGPLELGTSGAVFHDEDGHVAMSLYGADLQAVWGPLALRGELVGQHVDQDSPVAALTRGWYVQGIWDLGRAFAFVRQDGVDPHAAGAPQPLRWSLGGGWKVQEGLELRLEQDLGQRDFADTTWLQLAMSFGAVGPLR